MGRELSRVWMRMVTLGPLWAGCGVIRGSVTASERAAPAWSPRSFGAAEAERKPRGNRAVGDCGRPPTPVRRFLMHQPLTHPAAARHPRPTPVTRDPFTLAINHNETLVSIARG